MMEQVINAGYFYKMKYFWIEIILKQAVHIIIFYWQEICLEQKKVLGVG